MDGCMSGRMDGCLDGWMDGWTEGWMSGLDGNIACRVHIGLCWNYPQCFWVVPGPFSFILPSGVGMGEEGVCVCVCVCVTHTHTHTVSVSVSVTNGGRKLTVWVIHEPLSRMTIRQIHTTPADCVCVCVLVIILLLSSFKLIDVRCQCSF